MSALACAGSLVGAQGVIEPRHEIDGFDVTPWNCISSFVASEGRPIDVVGDVNGDGFDDLVFGGRLSGAGNCGYYDGFVSVVSGLDGAALWKVPGEYAEQGGLGYSISGAGDWNGDGTPDVVAGAPWADAGKGRVLLLSGDDGTLLYSLPNPYPATSNQCGYSVSGIEDLNADGHDEVIVGCIGISSGKAFVLTGGTGQIHRELVNPSPSTVGATHFGFAVRDGGDIDGDGLHDILVGNPFARNSANEHTGAVYVYSGATGALVREVIGPGVGYTFGGQVDGIGDQDRDGRNDFLVSTGTEFAALQSVYVISGRNGDFLWNANGFPNSSGAGDVNGDGIEDFLVGYPNYNVDGVQGRAYLIAGGSFSALQADFSGTSLGAIGSALSRAGDINHDGFADYVVAAGGQGGRAFIYLGRPAPRELRRVEGGSAGDWAGFAVSGAGDVDADGFDDVIVGAPKDDTQAGVVDAGSARVLSGFDGRTLIACQGSMANDYLGFAVSGAGDVNKDGFDDVIVGVPTSDLGGTLTDAGEARVYSGRDGTELRVLPGPSAGAQFGRTVSDAGDVNGDGHADVIVGAPYEDIGTLVDAGSATVYSGADWSELHRWTGAAASDYFGYSVSGAGDVNGDGREDIVVGAYGSDVNGSNTGSMTVYSGFDFMPLFTHHGSAADDFLGFSVSGAGDVNKDGFADVVVGAKQSLSPAGSGYARVLAGPTGTLLYQFDPDNGNSRSGTDGHQLLGYSVSGAGDVNGDGHDDVIIGAPQFGIIGIGTPGCARVHSGFDGGVLLYQFQGEQTAGIYVEFGHAVSAAGDVNGDGRADVIAGAYLRDSGGLTDSGAAFVYSLGYPGETPKRRKGQAPPGPVITFP